MSQINLYEKKAFFVYTGFIYNLHLLLFVVLFYACSSRHGHNRGNCGLNPVSAIKAAITACETY